MPNGNSGATPKDGRSTSDNRPLPGVGGIDLATFVSRASHQMRGTIGTLRGAFELLAAELDLTSDGAELLDMGSRNLSKLEGAVDDAALLIRRSFGLLEVKKARVDFAAVTAEVKHRLAARFENRRSSIALKVEGDASAFVGDQDIVREIVLRLVDNALKFSPAESVVDVRARFASDGLEIQVSDRGPGIAPGDEANLFLPYYHRQRGDDQLSAGNGLGLAVVQTLAVVHDGRANWAPRPGGGSVLTVRLGSTGR